MTFKSNLINICDTVNSLSSEVKNKYILIGIYKEKNVTELYGDFAGCQLGSFRFLDYMFAPNFIMMPLQLSI